MTLAASMMVAGGAGGHALTISQSVWRVLQGRGRGHVLAFL